MIIIVRFLSRSSIPLLTYTNKYWSTVSTYSGSILRIETFAYTDGIMRFLLNLILTSPELEIDVIVGKRGVLSILVLFY